MGEREDALHEHWLGLGPPGTALPREPDSAWGRFLRPLSDEQARVEASAEALRPEVDPRRADALLPDFERVLGDDPCLGPAAELPFAIRQSLAHQRWTARGGASRAFFVGLAAALGVTITIEESVPFETGEAESGDEMVPEDGRFEWIVFLPATQLIEFESGVAESGDAMGDFVPSPLECLIRRHAPAHTTVYFRYEE